jgi:hypothetical protein
LAFNQEGDISIAVGLRSDKNILITKFRIESEPAIVENSI